MRKEKRWLEDICEREPGVGKLLLGVLVNSHVYLLHTG